MAIALSEQTWSEGWEDPRLWKEESDLPQLFKDYYPGKSSIKQNKLPKATVLIMGLILCEGKLSDKAATLYDLLVPPEE